MIVGIDHIELVVRDVKQHVEFFQKLGFKVLTYTEHHGGSAEVQLPGDNQPIFELHAVEPQENPGINHIAFKCEDVEETYKDLMAQGIEFYRGVEPTPSTGRKNALLRDPDGWRLQLTDALRVEPVRTKSE